MSRSCRYKVVPSSRLVGWYNVVDTQDNGFVCVEVRGRAEANARCRNLNARVGPSPKPVGYVQVECQMCPATLLIQPGGSTVCPRCREEAEQIARWLDTREAQRVAAEEELTMTNPRKVTMAPCLD